MEGTVEFHPVVEDDEVDSRPLDTFDGVLAEVPENSHDALDDNAPAAKVTVLDEELDNA